jgi:hypothetical protein
MNESRHLQRKLQWARSINAVSYRVGIGLITVMSSQIFQPDAVAKDIRAQLDPRIAGIGKVCGAPSVTIERINDSRKI